MSFAIVDLVAEMFLSVFGNPYLVAAILIGVITLAIFALRGNLAVTLLVIVPLIIGIGVNAATTNLINIPTWIIISFFMIMGIMFSGFMLYLMRQ
jgi:hypothetical protein